MAEKKVNIEEKKMYTIEEKKIYNIQNWTNLITFLVAIAVIFAAIFGLVKIVAGLKVIKNRLDKYSSLLVT